MNSSIIYKLLSLVLLALSAAFGLCVFAGLILGESLQDASLQAFLTTIAIAIGSACIFHILGRRGEAKLFRREALCAIGLSWILCTVIGAIPYFLIVQDCGIGDAIFETASGLTTTGATAFPKFYEFPASLLFWRSLSQWVGGLGVVVFFVAILSSLGAGAKILFSNESSATSSDFDHGRVQSGAFQLLIYYLAISFTCMLAYKWGGMNWFQAINHAMTTVSTGGFSTEPMSMEQFQSPLLEWLCIFFMALGGITFVQAIRIFRGRAQSLRQSEEILWFLGIVFASTLLITFFLSEQTGLFPSHDSVRTALFQVVSIITTTGYSTVNFDNWLIPAQLVLLFLMAVGGCSGSTGGGIKVVRIVIAARAVRRSITLAFRPNVTVPMRVGGHALGQQAIHSVILFIILMVAIQLISALIVSAAEPELSFMTVFSTVQACLYNIGPGFADVGPTENFHFFQGTTKVLLSLIMILGRLELYAVMVLFMPSLWKRYS